jgi:hypothetical protein
MNKSISLDFDGVLHDYSNGWTGYVPQGEPVPGAVAFAYWLADQNIDIIISSCRAYTQIGRLAIRDWLDKHGFPSEFIHITCEKPHAEWYLDDRGIRFDGNFDLVRIKMEHQPWYAAQPEAQWSEPS